MSQKTNPRYCEDCDDISTAAFDGACVHHWRQAAYDLALENRTYARNNKRLGKVIQKMQTTMFERNKEIDLLLKVWCTGGCETGVGRWSGEELHIEDVEYVERLAERMRSHYNNRQLRKTRDEKTT